jgi:cellulose synthase/poly-beta-1,6-N-acetylglucosamine synthase-like glycosyltransferase
MNATQTTIATLFWLCAGLVAYAYAGYPPLIWLLSRLFGRKVEPPAVEGADLPWASLLIAAYNEDEVIAERLENALTMDYPPEKLEIVVGSDGSSDDTAAIVRRFVGERVRLLDYAQRRGKASVLNSAFPELTGEVVLLSDANTQIDPAAARKLVRWFRDPSVGAVCGRLVLTDPETGRNVDGLYWKYETFLKRCEGRLGALLGANGAIYAIRKGLYEPIPAGTIVDDFVIPLLAKQRTGCAIVYDCEAVAREETAPDVGAEFHRRCRIGAGGFQSIGMLRGLLSPRRGWVAFTFLSHKVLRWLCPFFLVGMLATNLLLANRTPYQVLLAGQAALYVAALTGALLPGRSRVLKLLRVATMFVSMNVALLVGFWRWLGGRQKGTWRRTARAAQPRGAVR